MSEAIIRKNRDALRTAVDALLAALDDDDRGSTLETRSSLVSAAHDVFQAATAVQRAYDVQTQRRSTEE